MATDSEIEAAARLIQPYVMPTLSDEDKLAVESAMYAGEPYEALAWFMGSMRDPRIKVPREIFLEAFAALNDEEKETYEPLLTSSYVI